MGKAFSNTANLSSAYGALEFDRQNIPYVTDNMKIGKLIPEMLPPDKPNVSAQDTLVCVGNSIDLSVGANDHLNEADT